MDKWAKNDRNLALKTINNGGLQVDEDTLTTLLEDQNISLRLLPKKSAKHHGIVSYMLPQKYGYRCNAGHLSEIKRPDDDGTWRCTRIGCIDEEEGKGKSRKAYPTRWVSA